VRITSENASANGVDGIVRATLVSLDNAPPLVMRAGERFDIIVANIVASTIIDLAPFFAGALAPDGRLIASGIIGEREPEVRDALDAAALRIEDVRTMGEWRAIEARPIRRAVI
jgi:ribosomal protein L11 methyltransferase